MTAMESIVSGWPPANLSLHFSVPIISKLMSYFLCLAFVIDAVVSKAYDRKLFQHAEFEAICARYWALLHSQPGANRTSDVITKEQYTQVSRTRARSPGNFAANAKFFCSCSADEKSLQGASSTLQRR